MNVLFEFETARLQQPNSQPSPGNGVMGSLLSAPGVRGGSVIGGLNGVTGDMRSGSSRPWNRGLRAVLVVEDLLTLREWFNEEGWRNGGGRFARGVLVVEDLLAVRE
jgi:hypothetical protein